MPAELTRDAVAAQRVARTTADHIAHTCSVTLHTSPSTWLKNFDRIRAGDLDDIERECYTGDGKIPLAEWLRDERMPPDPKYYRPYREEDATWYQVWETVTEGTPVTPPFATREELVDYLVKYGDEWDQKRGNGGYSRAAAEAFVNAGWAPSMVITMRGDGTQTMAKGIEVPLALQSDK